MTQLPRNALAARIIDETPPRLRGASDNLNVFPRSLQEEDLLVLPNSRSFQIAFAVLLGIIVLFRLLLFLSIIFHRKETILQLGQSSVLAVFVLAGAFCVGSCYLLMPLNDMFCLLREPFVLTPLTLMGNILLGRLWRINMVMSPVLTVGKQSEHQSDYLKTRLMDFLTILSDYEMMLEDMIKCRWKSAGSARKRKRSSIRQKIPIQQLVWLIVLLQTPQLVMQICNLAVPHLQSTQQLHSLAEGVAQPVCRHSCGAFPSWIGITLCAIPYLVTIFLSLHSQHLPSVFNEADAVRQSCKVFFLVLCIAGPAYALSDSLDAQTYLLSCIIFGLASPPCWFIVVSKLWPLWMGTSSNLNIKHILWHPSKRGSFVTGVFLDGNDEHCKSATLALTIGKMYEDMGMVQKSIALFEDALALWQWDPNRNEKELVGGFTVNEINAFSEKDLEFIINLKIAQGRVNGTFNSSQNTGQKNAAQAWLDALEIYERAPASINMTDRSIIFPIFSGLFVFLKGDKIEQDKECNFEQNLVRKFVRETKLHGDPVHFTRALAMQGEVKARLGKYNEALASFERLKAAYIPEEHSEGVSSAYGTDRSAQCYSQSALWHYMLGNVDEALALCEYVIDELLPKMDPKNVLNSCELILPLIRILKNRGQEKRMRKLFHKEVVQNFEKHFGKDGVTPCLPVFRPLLLLLDVCSEDEECPDLISGVEWLVSDEENGVPPDFLDSVYTKLCWSPNSMVAELCLRLAKKVTNQRDKVVLIEKGLTLSRKADRKMKDVEGNVKLRIAYDMHEPIYNEIKQMAETYGIDSHETSTSGSLSQQSSNIDPHNLPKSYLRHRSSSGRLTGDKTSSRSDSSLEGEQSIERTSSSLFGSSGRLSSSALMESVNEERECVEKQNDTPLTSVDGVRKSPTPSPTNTPSTAVEVV